MFLLLPCATIKDQVQIPKLLDIANTAPELNKARQLIKDYSNVEFLLKKIQDGQVIMTRKIEFDKYLKAQVDIMKACVLSSHPCPFAYTSYMDSQKTVSTSGLTTKQQWAIEMVMSRYTISSIYHAAAYNNLQFIFNETNSSFQKGYKNSPKLINNLQITFKYFNEGFQPLKRLSEVYPTLEQLFSKNNKDTTADIPQIRKQVFVAVNLLIACNLAYLKLEKYRLMAEFRSCKELAYSVYNLIKDTRTVLKKSGLLDKVHSDMRVYMDIGELFFEAYSFYFLLEQHEDLKNKQQYGFIKKQFQTMIVQNCVVCEQFISIAQKINKFAGKQNLDNAMFADNLVQTMLKQVQKKQYAYGINIHENKQLQVPTIQQVVASRISARNIFQSISQF